MKLRLRPPFAWLGLLPAVLSWAPSTLAAIPEGYTGTPYMGTPQEIPGRVELADLDEGGLDVAFFADHRRENAVAENYSPISGDDYRPGNLDLPNICKTNKSLEVAGVGSEDFWEDGSRYPSEDDLHWYYMGFAHTVDWVRVTVNVQQAGTYNVSSNWACANNPCGLSIWFNDGSGVVDNPDRPLDGANKTGTVTIDATNDYHIWRAYPNFTQVELSAGLQVMTFNLEVADHLQYGFLQFDLEGGGGTGSGGTGSGGTAGAPASGAGGTPGASGGGGVMMPGAAGTAVAMGGSGGSPASTAGTAGQPAGGTGMATAAEAQAESGCALTPRSGSSRSSAVLGVVLALSLLRRRRTVLARRR